MKYLAVVVLAALAITAHGLTDEEKAQVRQAAEGCITSSGVDKELIGKARSHEYTGRDEKLAKYYSCMCGKMGFQKADGTFDTDRMIEKLPGNADRETATKGVKKCAVHDAALSTDENAMNFIYCFYKAVGKDFKLY